MIDRAEKVYRIVAIVLLAVIVLGTLGFNVLLFITNKLYPPDSYKAITEPDFLEKRWELRELADNVYIVSEKIFNYGAGHLALVFILVGKRAKFPRMLLTIAIVPVVLYVCTLPFVLLDGGDYGGAFYTQNIRQILLNFSPEVVIAVAANVVKYAIERIKRKPEPEPAAETE